MSSSIKVSRTSSSSKRTSIRNSIRVRLHSIEPEMSPVSGHARYVCTSDPFDRYGQHRDNIRCDSYFTI